MVVTLLPLYGCYIVIVVVVMLLRFALLQLYSCYVVFYGSLVIALTRCHIVILW